MDETRPVVRVLSRRTVKPPPRPREVIPLTFWDVCLLAADYIQKGLLFPPPPLSIPDLVDHLEASLVETLATYYPVAGRFVIVDKDDKGWSVSIDCSGQGVEIIHGVADGVAVADVVPVGCNSRTDVPGLVRSFFPLNHAINLDGHDVPLMVVQVTELRDGVFLGFAYNHALSDGTAFWDFINAWAKIARAKLLPVVPDVDVPLPGETTIVPSPLFQRWSPQEEEEEVEVVLPHADLVHLTAASPPVPVPLRERMLHFPEESLAALKDRAKRELLAAGDAAGADAVTKFQALSSLLWRCVTRARGNKDQDVVFRATVNNRGRLRPPLPPDYFGNSILAASTERVPASELLERGHGWAAAAVGRAVATITDEAIRARVKAQPSASAFRLFDPNAMFVSSSPRFDMYACDFGWGRPIAARGGKANKYDGKVSLFPGRQGGGGIDAELVLAPDNMAELDKDAEFWEAVVKE